MLFSFPTGREPSPRQGTDSPVLTLGKSNMAHFQSMAEKAAPVPWACSRMLAGDSAAGAMQFASGEV